MVSIYTTGSLKISSMLCSAVTYLDICYIVLCPLSLVMGQITMMAQFLGIISFIQTVCMRWCTPVSRAGLKMLYISAGVLLPLVLYYSSWTEYQSWPLLMLAVLVFSQSEQKQSVFLYYQSPVQMTDLEIFAILSPSIRCLIYFQLNYLPSFSIKVCLGFMPHFNLLISI